MSDVLWIMGCHIMNFPSKPRQEIANNRRRLRKAGRVSHHKSEKEIPNYQQWKIIVFNKADRVKKELRNHRIQMVLLLGNTISLVGRISTSDHYEVLHNSMCSGIP
jgi:hypothetical protein